MTAWATNHRTIWYIGVSACVCVCVCVCVCQRETDYLCVLHSQSAEGRHARCMKTSAGELIQNFLLVLLQWHRSDVSPTAHICRPFERNKALTAPPPHKRRGEERRGGEQRRTERRSFGWVWTCALCSGSARMGCTVSFICCEEDFLQMPVYQHEEEEEKKKKKVRRRSREWGVSMFMFIYTYDLWPKWLRSR